MQPKLLRNTGMRFLTAACIAACGIVTGSTVSLSDTVYASETTSEASLIEVQEKTADSAVAESEEPEPAVLSEETAESISGPANAAEEPGALKAASEYEESDETAMYAAYLKTLNEYQDAIRAYDWQMSDGKFHYPLGSEPAALRPVAITDICGDAKPELLFVSVPNTSDYGGVADLHVFGWKNGSILELCHIPQWDAAVASGTHYALFQCEEDKSLYAYSYIGDETGFYSWYRFQGEASLSADRIADAEIAWMDYEDRPNSYTVDGQPVDQETYDTRCTELSGKAERTVLYSASESSDAIMGSFLQKDLISMNLNDAVAYLTQLASASFSAGEASNSFTLDSLNGLSLVFTSGAGAWDTDFTMEADGAFSGTYHDSNMGESGEGYDATLYLCPFTGRFDNLQQINATVYTADIAELNYTYAEGDEWIETQEGARVRYVAAEAYGLTDCTSVTIYLPGTPIADIPDDALFKNFYKEPTLDGVVIYGSGDFYTSDSPAGLLSSDSGVNSGAAPAADASAEGQIFPDSGTRYLTEDDLAGLSSTEIQTAINEIYARKGYIFNDDEVQSQFESFSWYTPSKTDMDSVMAQFNDFEQANVDLLASHL